MSRTSLQSKAMWINRKKINIGLEYKNWKLDIWGKNLTDKQYYQEFSPGEFVGSPDDVAWRGQPLSFGTAISVKF